LNSRMGLQGVQERNMLNLQEIKRLINDCSDEQCSELLQYIRARVNIHPLEIKLGCKAEIILEAISRASDLTLRGIRGIIAEAAFKKDVLESLIGWDDISTEGDQSYDFIIQDRIGVIRIQVKMQRQKNQRPMTAKEGYRIFTAEKWVVETQKTRGGTKNGLDTRPYRFDEFDILAVSLHPSTGKWSDFMYVPSRWLLPRSENPDLIMKFQPVSKRADSDWTDNILNCIKRFRSNKRKTISVN
jgi:hypothetical protein